MRLTLNDLLSVCDDQLPVWINAGPECVVFDNIRAAAGRISEHAAIEYITIDGDGILTIEIETEDF